MSICFGTVLKASCQWRVPSSVALLLFVMTFVDGPCELGEKYDFVLKPRRLVYSVIWVLILFSTSLQNGSILKPQRQLGGNCLVAALLQMLDPV